MKALPRVPLALLLALALACRSGATPPPPESRVDPVTDTFHGVEFVDDYRWLEDQDSPETRAWIEAQNAYAERIVGETPIRARLRERLRELTDRDDVGSTREAGAFEYFTLRPAGAEAPILYRRPAGGDGEEPTIDGTYEVVLDPADFDPSYRTLLSVVDFTSDGGLLMYSVRRGGADEIAVRIRDVESGQDLPDRLPDALYSGLGFDASDEGFYYTHRDRYAGPRIRHHVLGTPPDEDTEIWGEGYGPTAFIDMDVVADGRYRIFTVQHGWASNDLFIQEGDGPVRPMVEGVEAHFQHRYRDGRIYIRTDWEAPSYRIMVADPSRPEAARWQELIPEGEDVLDGYTFVDGRMYVTYLHDVAQRISVYEADGTPSRDLDLPDGSSVSVRSGEDDALLVTVSSYLRPSTTYELDEESGDLTIHDEPEIDVDLSPYEVTELWFTSTGGARAPVHVLHRADIELDGSHPTILNGYGGFNANILPGFSATRIAWLELGGVYAVATLRGGAEFGELWHRDGMLENKQHVFDDFIAASEALIEAGFTSPERLGISGGSNGGLLVGAAMTQRPELYRAVLCTYPDLDMVRFWSFQDTNNMPALLEYGDARIPSQFEAIRRYSPYQAVRDGVAYPAVMLATGDLDTRVSPLQARRMTARLQAASSSGLPVILWYDASGGHAAGRGRPTSLRIEDDARELAFMAQQLGLGTE